MSSSFRTRSDARRYGDAALAGLIAIVAGGWLYDTDVRYDVRTKSGKATPHKRYHVASDARRSSRLERAFERAVSRALDVRGYQRVAKASADVFVSVKVLPTKEASGGDDTVLMILKHARSRRVLWVGWAPVASRGSEDDCSVLDAVAHLMRQVPTA